MPESTVLLSASQAYRRLLKYAYPYWPGFLLSVIGMVVVASAEAGFAAIMKPMLDGSFVERDPHIIAIMPWALVGLFLYRGLGSFLASYCMDWVGRHVIHKLRHQLFSHLLSLPSSFYDSNTRGNLTAKLIYDVEQVAMASTRSLTVVIRDTLTVFALLAWMIYLSWKLSVFFMALVPAMAVIVVYVSKRYRRISHAIQSSMGNVNQVTHQVVDGNRMVKVYNAQQQERDNFRGANEYNRRQNMKLALTTAIYVPLIQFLGAFALSAVLYFVLRDADLKNVTVGTFMSFLSASIMLLVPLRRLTEITQQVQKGVAAAQSIFYLLDQPAEINQGSYRSDHVRGKIEFRRVQFRYQGASALVLNDINLSIAAGQSVAIVGRSGSGKSSLASLIPRFYDIESGEILVDDKPIQSFDLANLRQHIAIVSQEIALFNDSIYNNIAYGCNREKPRQAVIDAARQANALEFIEAMPQQFDSVIGDQGALLSGGQRQRVSIARALLKNAPILILDEATSALDNESERAIQSALKELMKNRTTFIIAHRLSTIENADLIVVLHQGRIVEQGKHQALLANNSYYAKLHQQQVDHEQQQGNEDE